jgi:hypothetical protein
VPEYCFHTGQLRGIYELATTNPFLWDYIKDVAYVPSTLTDLPELRDIKMVLESVTTEILLIKWEETADCMNVMSYMELNTENL